MSKPLRNIGALLFGFTVAALFAVYTQAAETRFGGVLYTWPSAHGVSGKLLKTDGAKTLSWDGAPGVPSVPAGVVMYTTSGSCPTGWAGYGGSGEYFVAQASGLGDTYGTALSGGENRATGTHTHTHSESLSVSASSHSHGVNDPGHLHGGEDDYGAADLAGEGGSGKVGGGGYGSRTAGVDVSGNISIDNYDTNVSVTGTSASISDSTGTAGTNAPYIILRACRKS